MKIRRFTGTDMRDAMRQVRAALGADAVILETSRNAAGVEISAAMDANGSTTDITSSGRASTGGIPGDRDDGPVVRIDQGSHANGGWYQPPRAPNAATASELDEMRNEMRSIRSLLEAQLGRLLWDEESRQSPATATLLRHFTQLGLDPDIARQLATRAATDHPVGGWLAGLRTLAASECVSDSVQNCNCSWHDGVYS